MINSSTPAVLRTLNWMLKCNYQPIPLNHGQKTVADRDAYSPAYQFDASRWETEQLNIGLLTGPTKHGPIDVDLDSKEAISLASHFLPPTFAVFGRPSKGKSHYLYETEATTFPLIQFKDPTPPELLQGNAVILELRGDSGHTMAPGSLHPANEIVAWSYEPNPKVLTIKAQDLIYAGRMLAACSLLARYAWTNSNRHELSLQLGGIFQRLNKPQAEAENFISALITYSGEDDPGHLAAVRTSYTKASLDKATKGARSLIQRFSDHNPAMIKCVMSLLGVEDSWLEEFNEKYATVFIGAKYRVAIRPQKQNEPLLFVNKEDFKDFNSGTWVTTASGKRKPAAELWLQHSERALYKNVEFLPGISQANTPNGTLNKFTGWAINPYEHCDSCAAFRQMLEQYITNPDKPEQARWLYTFFAHILREPMNKQRAAVVIIGPQNIGKSVFVNYFGKILGRHHLNLADASKIHGRFNSHLEQCLLLHSEEALYAQDKKHRSIVKDLIANKLISFEEKYLGVWTAQSYTRLIYTSNDDNAAPVELKDTRHSIFNLNESERTPPSDLVKKLYEESVSTGPQSLMYYLLNYADYDPLLLQTPLETTAKRTAVLDTLAPTDDYWFNKLYYGELLPFELRWAQGDDKNNFETNKLVYWPRRFSRIALYADYNQHTTKLGVRRASSYAFYMQLAKFIKPTKLTPRPRVYLNTWADDLTKPAWLREIYSGQHQTFCNLPSLEKCRAAFNKYTGQDYEWPTPQTAELQDEETNDDSPRF